jgi:hypothetical protein
MAPNAAAREADLPEVKKIKSIVLYTRKTGMPLSAAPR